MGRLLMLGSVTLALSSVSACGDDGTSETPGGSAGGGADGGTWITGTGDGGTTTRGGGDAAGGTGDGATGVPGCTLPGTADQPFLVLFGYQDLLPPGASDIYMMRPVQKFSPIKLTDFSLKGEGKTCQWGCTVEDTLQWIAVNGDPADANGFDFQMGKFNSCLEVALIKGGVLENKADFAFAGNFIYYSEQKNCQGASCQYRIARRDITKLDEGEKVLVPSFPPDEDPDWKNGDSTYKGRFRLSPDGSSVVILGPTIRSQRVYLWTQGTLHQLDYLCDGFQNGNCVGTGSTYSDDLPVAISQDSKEVVMFARNDRAFRVYRYSTVNLALNEAPHWSTLLEVPAGSPGNISFEDAVCAVRKPWQWVGAGPMDPVYTPDGRVLWVGTAACDPSLRKPETDVILIDPSWIGDLTPVEEHELINVTRNAKGDVPANTQITSLDLSPDGRTVVFTASPYLTSQFEKMKEGDSRQYDDKEVYSVSLCGTGKTQLTSRLGVKAQGVQAVALPDVSTCPSSPLFQ